MVSELQTSDPRYLVKFHDLHHQNLPTAEALSDEEILGQDEQPFYSVYAPSPTESQRKITPVAPRFALPSSDVHSIYPPSDGTVPLKRLPHMVFKDPHLPWERKMGSTPPPKDSSETAPVPWLALWVCQPDELLSPDIGILAGKILSSTRSVRLRVSDVLQAGASGMCTPYKHDANRPDEENSDADFIFVNKDVFQHLCQSYTADGSSSGTIDLTSYGYLAHVRKVGGDALKATAASVEDDCVSVVIANRTGPLQNPDNSSMNAVAHLVSLEGIDADFKTSTNHDFVTMCSLFSWTFNYTLQDDQVEFDNALKAIGTPVSGIEFLRPSQERYVDLLSSSDTIQQRIGQRIRDGYSLTRYRTLSGEETMALQRGVFIPTLPSNNAALNKSIHLFSSQLQILDTEVGMLDDSYATAWNLGRKNALVDQKFLSAFVRLRTTLLKRALPKAEVLKCQDGDAVQAETNKLVQTTSAELYDENNDPSSTDWAVVLAWVYDALYLANISWHDMIMESSSLPEDSIRFFYIDPTWLNAYVDGTLSIGNHVGGDQDSVRATIKLLLQEYFTTKNAKSGYPPQVPMSGFLLRSPLVADFPDLDIQAPRRINDSRAPILKRVILAPDVLLILFDRPLTEVEFPQGIEICQPPHQQCFVASNGKIDKDNIEMVYRNITAQPASCSHVSMAPIDKPVSKPSKPFLNSQYGIILAKNLTQDVYDFLKAPPRTNFSETAPSSALLALHLSYISVKLRLTMPAPDPADVVDDSKVTMLEIQDQKREKDPRTNMQNTLQSI